VRDVARIDAGKYLRILGSVAQNRRQACEYCGNETLTITNPWFCSYCESLLFESTQSVRVRDAALTNGLDAVNGFIDTGEYGKAVDAYSKIILNYNEPAFHYRYALLHIAYSNSEVSKIRYDREGFMEENAALREHASLLVSDAKRIFNHAIAMCRKESGKGSLTPVGKHIEFMSYVKLGRLRSAKGALERMQQGSLYLYKYAEMVLDAEMGNSGGALAAADWLLRRDTFSINALYYVALAALRSNQPREAQRILEGLGAFVKSPAIGALVGEARALQQAA